MVIRILVIDNMHIKNRNALQRYKNIEIIFSKDISLINNFDYIYSPSIPINVRLYPNKKIVFGPHFCVLPHGITNRISINSKYLQPSEWVVNLWKEYEEGRKLDLCACPFGVDTDRFCETNQERSKVFIYFKRRKPEELGYLQNFLSKKGIDYRIFDYVKRYNEYEYLDYIQKSKYGIILDAHESQGFAIEEALSCNVPLLVWNVRLLSQEYGSNYPNTFATSIPYWDGRCGEYFYDRDELELTFNKFVSNIEKREYKPREYVLENLSMEVCEKRFMKLFK